MSGMAISLICRLISLCCHLHSVDGRRRKTGNYFT